MSHSHDDFEFEPQPGLPAPLPAGEHLLWQGSPDWKLLAVRAYHARKAALYFAFLMAWRIANGWLDGQPLAAVASGCAVLLVMGAAVIAILSTLAWFSARGAVFSITSRRILIRHGVAVPMTLNVPFQVIESADLRMLDAARGDIVLRLTAHQRVGYLITWPYLRPGHFAHPQPSLRALARADQVAEVLREALLTFNSAANESCPAATTLVPAPRAAVAASAA